MNFVSTGKEQLGIGLKLKPDADQVLHQPEHEGAHGDQARPGQLAPVLALLLLQVGFLSIELYRIVLLLQRGPDQAEAARDGEARGC